MGLNDRSEVVCVCVCVCGCVWMCVCLCVGEVCSCLEEWACFMCVGVNEASVAGERVVEGECVDLGGRCLIKTKQVLQR